MDTAQTAETAKMAERVRCMKIIETALKDKSLMRTLTPAGALLAVIEQIADETITKVSA